MVHAYHWRRNSKINEKQENMPVKKRINNHIWNSLFILEVNNEIQISKFTKVLCGVLKNETRK